MSPFARNYFGNMSLNSFRDNSLILYSSQEINEVPENIISEFKSILQNKFSESISIKIEVGDVLNSPIEEEQNNKKNEKRVAETDINKDKEIQNFINKFNGKIKTDTIKPIK